MAELTLREIQLASLGILKSIDSVCRENGLRYSIGHGTLLGAVRHKGFIPWDDDVDIDMPRLDYDALTRVFNQEAEKYPHLRVLRSTEENPLPFLITRISDTRYKMIGECADDVPDLGAFVDVYPFDGAGNTPDETRNRVRHCKRNAVAYLRSANFKCSRRNISAFKAGIKKAISLYLGNPSKWLIKAESEATALEFDSVEYVANLMWPVEPQPLFYPKRCFDELVDIEFEGILVKAPANYDELLTIEYGDYMTLPSPERRVPHHKYVLFRRNASA